MSQDPNQKYFNNGMYILFHPTLRSFTSDPLPVGVNFVNTVHNDTYPTIDPKKANLAGKYVLVTGASKGVGKAIALAYAQAGASGIALAARSPLSSLASEVRKAAQEAGREEPQILTLTVDVTDRQSVDAAAATVSREFPQGVDILINNAGYLTSFRKVGDSDPEEWWKEWEVNLKGLYYVTRSFLPQVLSSKSKTIINISSIGATFTSSGASGYQTSKLAVLRFTEFLMSDHGDQGLLAYSIHPGGVKTELAHNLPKELLETLQDEPELAAHTLVWLTKERREWLANRYVSANWDVEELEGRKTDVLKGDLLRVRLAVNLF